jgi:hypothetical protein
MEKVAWTNRVKNEVLPRVRKERNILFAEGKSIAGGRGRRRKLLLRDLKEKRKYWEFQVLDNTACKICFGRGYSHFARHTGQ